MWIGVSVSAGNRGGVLAPIIMEGDEKSRWNIWRENSQAQMPADPNLCTHRQAWEVPMGTQLMAAHYVDREDRDKGDPNDKARGSSIPSGSAAPSTARTSMGPGVS